jgi:deoxyribodipyrimidine photo-lyase
MADLKSNVMVWFRDDLRLHDNVTLYQAKTQSRGVYPVFCFDPRWFRTNHTGRPKIGSIRAQFLLETVADLRKNLRTMGSDLIVRIGKPEELIPKMAANIGAVSVYASKAYIPTEAKIELQLERSLCKNNVSLETVSQSTLFHESDIPWPIENLPEVFSQFRIEIEKTAAVRDLVPSNQSLPPIKKPVEPGQIPTLTQLGLKSKAEDPRTVLSFRGGENAALARLHNYFWETDCLKEYKKTRNGVLGANYSSKFSPWLANGALSPRYVHNQVMSYETQRVKNESTYWLVFELFWRDYFKFISKKHGENIFRPTGIRDSTIEMEDDKELFSRWANGRTGVPFIDANMRELKATGFMSNRGRQNVASFLVKDLKVNWTWGASYFESQLIDYDVASNWGNWNYIAGVGNDPRKNRYFNIISQALRYDDQGNYIRHWIPELKKISGRKIHYPSELKSQELNGLKLGSAYQNPVVPLAKWF